jgi:glycosyltransferase involved in cell wall biosynthesis
MKKIATINNYLDHPSVQEKYSNIMVDVMEPPMKTLNMIRYALRIVVFSDYDCFFAEGTRQIFFMALVKLIFLRSIVLICRPRLKIPPNNFFSYMKEWIKIKIFKMGVNHFIVISKGEIQEYNEQWGISKEKMTYIPFKVNSEKLLSNMKVGEGNFIYSGGDSLRDYNTLFKAVEGLDITVNILTNLDFDKNSVPNNVHIVHNSGTFDEFYTPCAQSKFAVFPIESGHIRSAGQGSYLGAMFLGKAVIVSDTPGVEDLIDNNINGIIVPSGNAEILRKKTLKLWDDDDLRRRLGRAAKKHVKEHYTHDKYIENIYRVLKKVLKV